MVAYYIIINSTLQRLWTHLVNIKVRYLKQTVSILGHFWDFDVQLQISDWKVTQVLNLRDKRKWITPVFTPFNQLHGNSEHIFSPGMWDWREDRSLQAPPKPAQTWCHTETGAIPFGRKRTRHLFSPRLNPNFIIWFPSTCRVFWVAVKLANLVKSRSAS